MRWGLLALALASKAVAEAPSLGWPVDCVLGESCFIQNYVDQASGPEIRDFACAALSYDGHTGTDIAIHSLAAMAEGVTVQAAAPGIVASRRNTLEDQILDGPPPPQITGRECGNGLRISHGNGWETLYCHLKQGSLLVGTGDHVTTGTPLGEIGASGNTTFPHLHFELLKGGQPLDPFNPTNADCGETTPLWTDSILHIPGSLIATAIDDHVPDYGSLKADLSRPKTWSATSPALVVWTFGFGIRAGDTIRLSLTGPQGPIFAETIPNEKRLAQFFYAWGKRRPATGWPSGRYTAQASFLRDDTRLDAQSFTFTLD